MNILGEAVHQWVWAELAATINNAIELVEPKTSELNPKKLLVRNHTKSAHK